MIHSIVSCDDIFAATPVQSVMKPVDGGMVELEEYGGRTRVRRLISTNQRLYLENRYQPYSDIKP